MPLAASLGSPMAMVRSEVPLAPLDADGPVELEPVVGSFCEGGMAYAVVGEGSVSLVAVAPSTAAAATLAVPASVEHGGASYSVTSIGPRALSGCGAESALLPASVRDVDPDALASPALERVEVDPASPYLASFDGVLWDASLTRLLSIPGGRQGAVRIPKTAEEVEASAFSHIAGVDAVSADAGGAAYSSWEGCLYDADGTTLLRVPPAAESVSIREGCTAVAAGALEGCVRLERIDAPATLGLVSPFALSGVPTVELPVDAVMAGEEGSDAPPQINEMVALASAAGGSPQIDPARIRVSVSEPALADVWAALGFACLAAGGGEDVEEGAGGSEVQRAIVVTEEGASLEEVGEGGLPPSASSQSAGAYGAKGATFYTNVDVELTLSWYFGNELAATSTAKATSTTPVTLSLDELTKYAVLLGDYGAYGMFYLSDTGQDWITVTFWPIESKWFDLVGIYDDAGFKSLAYGKWYTGSKSYYLCLMGKACSYKLKCSPPGGKVETSTVYGRYGMSFIYADSSHSTLFEKKKVDAETVSGYTFMGYKPAGGKDEDLWINAQHKATSKFTWKNSGATLEGVYKANTIKLTWDPNGGSEKLETKQEYGLKATLSLPSGSPSRKGYEFKGWWTVSSSTGGEEVTGKTPLPAVDTTYYARWSAIKYDIGYELNGGSVSGNPSAYTVESATFDLKAPTRTGYTFVGWSGTGIEGGPSPSVRVGKGSIGDRSYVAHWQANAYVVEYYDRPGATLLSMDAGFVYDEARSLASEPASAPTPGYTALGWADEPGQESAAYAFGSEQSNLAAGGTKGLYLAESPNLITIAWETEGTTFAETSAPYSPSGTVPLPTSDPVRGPGWAFMGWRTEPNGLGAPVTAASPLPTEGATYHAHWVPMVEVVAPLDVTIELDLLGTEASDPAAAYLESRSAGALKVVAIGFAPLAGADEIFGADASDVRIQVVPSGTTGSDVSFALDAAAIEESARKLLPFVLPYGYGTRMDVAYRLDGATQDVVARIDASRFLGSTTPVCQVAYTVELVP